MAVPTSSDNPTKATGRTERNASHVSSSTPASDPQPMVLISPWAWVAAASACSGTPASSSWASGHCWRTSVRAVCSASCKIGSPERRKAEPDRLYCSSTHWRSCAATHSSPSRGRAWLCAARAAHHCVHSPKGSLTQSVSRACMPGWYKSCKACCTRASRGVCCKRSRCCGVSSAWRQGW